MTTLVEQLISKMGLGEEPNVLEKTTELLRLLELRSTNVPLQINEYGKIVLCADIACSVLDIGFDKEQALKLSALRKTHYANNKRMFEKLLELNKLASIKDICVQLSLNEVAHKAEDILAMFKKFARDDADPDHPQYAAMAVFHACRLLKKKVSKSKLMPFSNLRPTQWQQLEQQFERLIAKHLKDSNVTTAGVKNKLTQQEEQNVLSKKQKSSEKTEIEEYEKWKSRMLATAEAKLKELESIA
ncbi:PREDICTED: origin recognition complex subunit 6 [Drosophila arizonae]|uniref:Origin recognition complex subunit 6 n=1 Tax=Drosophila arizonae TaxID=7263 RepID=A0ABM1PCV0_DROAR|nr:PREDICTED: origin recognition complex subunit 6 [Drosophila arizonae]